MKKKESGSKTERMVHFRTHIYTQINDQCELTIHPIQQIGLVWNGGEGGGGVGFGTENIRSNFKCLRHQTKQY